MTSYFRKMASHKNICQSTFVTVLMEEVMKRKNKCLKKENNAISYLTYEIAECFKR